MEEVATTTESTGSVQEGAAAGDSTAAPVEAASSQSTASTQEASTNVDKGAQPPVDTWAPTFKFKANDKEMEFDDFIKPIIKTKDHEQKLKEIYEKAYGLEEVKTSRKAAQDKAKEYQDKYSQVETSLQTLGQYVKKKDYRSFFDTLKIPKEDVIRYAIEELKYQELPPEQKAAIDQQRQMQDALRAQEFQNQNLHTQMQNIVLQQATNELTMELSRPEVSSVTSAYDARVGMPGAFRAEVIRRGQYYEAVHQTSPPVGQLVKEVLALVGGVGHTTPVGNNPQTTQGNAIVQQDNKPAIPSFKGASSKSPAKKVPTSIDDLRKMRQQLINQNT
jgi:hypothetical protein